VTDNLFLVTTGLSQMFTASTLYRGITGHWFSAYLQTLVWPLVHMTQMLSVFTIVLIACNRYIAICHPYRAERLCSLAIVRVKVGYLHEKKTMCKTAEKIGKNFANVVCIVFFCL